jgi:hypothetical protein
LTLEFDVELDIMEGAVLLTPLECGSTEAMLSVEPIRSSTVGEEHHNLVNCLRIGGEKILANGLDIKFLISNDEEYPEHVGVFQVSPRVSLRSVDQVGVLGGVPDEEGRSVETDPVQDAVLGLQFDSETMEVTSGIS